MTREMAMLNRLLPQPADNTYRGHKLALVLFVLLLIMKGAISLGSIFNGRTAASSADGIPIDSYTPAGARAVVSLFGVLGLSNLMIVLVGLVVLLRYRSLVPFMFALFVLQDVSRRMILQVMPIARTGTPPGSTITLVILGVMVVGLALSLWTRHDPDRVHAPSG